MMQVFRHASSRSWLGLLVFSQLVACGYSREEYEQKVRELEKIGNQLSAQQQQRKKCDADYQEALREVDDLKAKLLERGLTLENLSGDLDQQRKALEEYQLRLSQFDEMRRRYEVLKTKLDKLTSLGLKVDVRDNRMVIQLPGDVLFASGRAELAKEGEAILLQVAEVIRTDPDLAGREFQVAGHTDSLPLRNRPFKDNWDLSAMRARSVLIYLTKPVTDAGGGLDARNWSAAGYADTDPVARNDSEEGRKRNRRVELVVLPNVGEMLNLSGLLRGSARATTPPTATPPSSDAMTTPPSSGTATTPPGAAPAPATAAPKSTSPAPSPGPRPASTP